MDKEKKSLDNVPDYISGVNERIEKFTRENTRCADIAVYLLNSSATSDAIRKSINEDPAQYIKLLQKQGVVRQQSGRYELTGLGELFAKIVSIHKSGMRLDVEKTSAGEYKASLKTTDK